MSEEKDKGGKVDTGGGAYIGGSVNVTGGGFVGRDQHVHGDQVYGDKVGGDKVAGDKKVVHGDEVGGDKISISDVKGEQVAIAAGREARAEAKKGLEGEELAQLFQTVYQKIETRPEDPDVDKEELVETVQKVEKEAAKGEEANPKKVERWLKFLAGMAPDILEVTAATLANPVAGVATAIRRIAEKAQAEAGSA